jgi:hypothetical protein
MECIINRIEHRIYRIEYLMPDIYTFGMSYTVYYIQYVIHGLNLYSFRLRSRPRVQIKSYCV